MVGDQWCCGIKIKCFCFTLTVIFHIQVEVHVEFTYLSVDGVECTVFLTEKNFKYYHTGGHF